MFTQEETMREEGTLGWYIYTLPWEQMWHASFGAYLHSVAGDRILQEIWVHVYAIEYQLGWKMVCAKCTVKEIFWG